MKDFMEIVILIALILVFSFALAWFTAFVINSVFGAAFLGFVFGGKISFWQAFGLNVLIGLTKGGSSKSK